MNISNKAKIGIAAGLTAAVLAAVPSVRDRAVRAFSDSATNIIYDDATTGTTRYELKLRRIRYGDRIDTIVGGNPLLADYTVALNKVNPTKLKPGMDILVPMESSSAGAKTLHQLTHELYGK